LEPAGGCSNGGADSEPGSPDGGSEPGGPDGGWEPETRRRAPSLWRSVGAAARTPAGGARQRTAAVSSGPADCSVADPGSGIRCLFDPRDPGWVKNSRSESGMNNPDHISESLETIIFWL
jgi:hypothetical protein